jgi:hypothetical protein
MKVALAQINPTVGDLAGNEGKILAEYRPPLPELSWSFARNCASRVIHHAICS